MIFWEFSSWFSSWFQVEAYFLQMSTMIRAASSRSCQWFSFGFSHNRELTTHVIMAGKIWCSFSSWISSRISSWTQVEITYVSITRCWASMRARANFMTPFNSGKFLVCWKTYSTWIFQLEKFQLEDQLENIVSQTKRIFFPELIAEILVDFNLKSSSWDFKLKTYLLDDVSWKIRN